MPLPARARDLTFGCVEGATPGLLGVVAATDRAGDGFPSACASSSLVVGRARGVGPRRQRPRRRGPFRWVFSVVSQSESSVGSPLGRTRSGSTSAPGSAILNVRRAAEDGCDGCGRPTCDAGGCCGPPFCDGAPGANGTNIVGLSCSVAANDRTEPDGVNVASRSGRRQSPLREGCGWPGHARPRHGRGPSPRLRR